MSKKIKLSLNSRSIDRAVKELETYKTWVDKKSAELAYRLALIGAREASVRFTTAIYDGINDVSVSLEPTDKGYKILAEGEAVCFIEFGAGVHHNGKEPYPNRPKEVAKIGEYGKGRGKRDTWVYIDEDGKHFTHGNPAAMPMWFATKEMEMSIDRIVREVFR